MAVACRPACTVAWSCVNGATSIGLVLKVISAMRSSGRRATKSLSRPRTTWIFVGMLALNWPPAFTSFGSRLASMLELRSIRMSTSAPLPVRRTWVPLLPGPASPRMAAAIAPQANARQRKPAARPHGIGRQPGDREKRSVSLRRRSSGSAASGSSSSHQRLQEVESHEPSAVVAPLGIAQREASCAQRQVTRGRAGLGGEEALLGVAEEGLQLRRKRLQVGRFRQQARQRAAVHHASGGGVERTVQREPGLARSPGRRAASAARPCKGQAPVLPVHCAQAHHAAHAEQYHGQRRERA
jgi:hypothetical protein